MGKIWVLKIILGTDIVPFLDSATGDTVKMIPTGR